jgi:hypothetical protein
MIRLALTVVVIAACGNHDSKSSTWTGDEFDGLADRITEDVQKAAAAKGRLALGGDATVYELVERKLNNREQQAPVLVLHAGGLVEVIDDKTGKMSPLCVLKNDGSVLGSIPGRIGAEEIGWIADREIRGRSGEPFVSIDGNTVAIVIHGKTVKSVLAADGTVTVLDSPHGAKWRIEAKDPAVMRTAFLALAAVSMRTALD